VRSPFRGFGFGGKFTFFQLDNETERRLVKDENLICKNRFYRAKYLL